MQLFSITQLLSDAGISAPDLCVLNPNHENYTAFLLQPQGDIEADTNGVRNADPELARQQHAAFLADAVTERSAIAISPEYSMPWQVLEERLRAGVVPAAGAVWVLGAESITLEQLGAFRDRMSDLGTVLYEQLEPQPGRFLDPVVYVFSLHFGGVRAEESVQICDRVALVLAQMVNPNDLSHRGNAENEQPTLRIAVGERRDGPHDQFLHCVNGTLGDGSATNLTASFLPIKVLTFKVVVGRLGQKGPRSMGIVKNVTRRWS